MNFWRVVHVGIAFFVLFTAFNSGQTVVSEALDQRHYSSLGFFSLAALYVTFAGASPFTTSVIEKLGAKKSMGFGSFCYFCWVISGLFPIVLDGSSTSKIIVWIVMIVSGMINGFGASILWVGQGKYVTDGSTPNNKGLHFGVFWSVLMLSQILGSAIAAFIIDKFSQKVFFSTMGIIALGGFGLFLTLTQPINKIENEGVNIDDSDKLLESYPDEEILDQERPNSLPNFPKVNESDPTKLNLIIEENPKSTFKSTMRLLFTIKMLKVVQFMILTGFNLAYFGTYLPKLIANTVEDEDEKLTKPLYGMIVFGVGEVVGGIMQGKIIDRTNNKFGVFITLCVVSVTIALTTYTHSREKYSYLWFLVALGWGLSDSVSNTSNGSIGGSQFENDIEPFAIFKFVQSFVVFVFLIVEGFIKNASQIEAQRWYLIGGGIYAIFACILTMTIDWKKERKQIKNNS